MARHHHQRRLSCQQAGLQKLTRRLGKPTTTTKRRKRRVGLCPLMVAAREHFQTAGLRSWTHRPEKPTITAKPPRRRGGIGLRKLSLKASHKRVGRVQRLCMCVCVTMIIGRWIGVVPATIVYTYTCSRCIYYASRAVNGTVLFQVGDHAFYLATPS